ncbi:MAG: Fur family transcriptional regulator [Candidatus Andersenbacteria bacterium]
MAVSEEQLKESLREHGLKVTPARMGVLRILMESQVPLSVQAIIEQMKSLAIDQATVYRTLNTFETAGLVHVIDFQYGHGHYELASRPHHHHLVCRSCGRVEDVEDCRVLDIEKSVVSKRGFASIEEHALEFFGTCKACDRVA